MRAWILTVLRMQGFELKTIGLATIAWTLAAIFLVWRMGQFTTANPECFADFPSGSHCSDILTQFAPWQQAADVLLLIVVVAPFAIGLILGAPVVAAEIEHGTAQIGWSLSLSRVRWLAWRTVPLLLAVIAMLAVYAAGGEVLVRGKLGFEPGFLGFGERGLLVIVRGLMILALAVLVGAWIGRTLPGLIVAAAVAGVITFGLHVGLDAWRASEAVVESDQQLGRDPDLLRGLSLGQAAVLADGSVTRDRHADRLPAQYQEGFLILPASAFWSWILREGAILLLVGGSAALGVAGVLRGRRPL